MPTWLRNVLLATPLVLVGCSGPGTSTWNEIAASTWRLAAFEDEPVVDELEITLQIEAPSQLFGTTGVNRYFGSFLRSGASGFRCEQLGTTRMAGPPEAMKAEERFLRLLRAANEVEIRAGRLLFLTNGAPVLSFVRA